MKRRSILLTLPLLAACAGNPTIEQYAAEKPLLDVVMRHAEGNQSKAADWLGINRNTLRRKLLDHKLIKP